MARLMPAWFALCLALFTADVAVAETYPAHPIRIIVSSAAGGPLDVICRAVAERISAELKQPVVVEAKPGAGGNLAADFVSKSAPDGYTLLFTLSTTLTVNPYLYKDLSFNLKPITVVNYSTQTLFVHPTLPVSNIAEFIAWAKKDGPVLYAHGGNGTSSHLVMEYFRLLAGFQTTPVPYRGAAAMISDFIAGQFKVSFGSTSGLLPLATAGKIRALAVSTAQRSPLIPDVPTIAETLPSGAVTSARCALSRRNVDNASGSDIDAGTRGNGRTIEASSTSCSLEGSWTNGRTSLMCR